MSEESLREVIIETLRHAPLVGYQARLSDEDIPFSTAGLLHHEWDPSHLRVGADLDPKPEYGSEAILIGVYTVPLETNTYDEGMWIAFERVKRQAQSMSRELGLPIRDLSGMLGEENPYEEDYRRYFSN